MVPDLGGDDFLLKPCQQLLRFGQGQTQIGDVAEIIGSADLHDVQGLPLAPVADLHQPQNPGHALPHPQNETRKCALGPCTPNLATVPWSSVQ